jgi:hypothetical protein
LARRRKIAKSGLALALALAAAGIWLQRLGSGGRFENDEGAAERASSRDADADGDDENRKERNLAKLLIPHDERLGVPVLGTDARDPFARTEPIDSAPPESPSPAPPADDEASTAGAHREEPPSARPPLPALAGILLAGARRIAVIDGELRNEGDSFGDGWRLAQVRTDAVELAWRGDPFVVPLVDIIRRREP